MTLIVTFVDHASSFVFLHLMSQLTQMCKYRTSSKYETFPSLKLMTDRVKINYIVFLQATYWTIYLYKAVCHSVCLLLCHVFFNQVLNSVSQLWELIETWGFHEDIKPNQTKSYKSIPIHTKPYQTKPRVSQLWDQIETWGFRVDIKYVRGIGLMMMSMMMRRKTARWMTTTRMTITTRMTMMTQVSQLWDQIET